MTRNKTKKRLVFLDLPYILFFINIKHSGLSFFMSKPFLKLSNITLSLKSKAGLVRILNDVNLNVLQGEAVALVGPSGSGKSSLLMLMGGLERPSSGKIHILDQEISKFDQSAMTIFRRDMIGIIFQSFHLIPTMTALENVMIPLEIMKSDAIFEKSWESLKKVGLNDRTSHYPTELSGGEQQRVALARALVTKPRLILADEPTGNLDKDSGDLVTKMLFELKDEVRSTMVIVTHSEDLAGKCDRIISINDGELTNDPVIG